MAQITLTAKSGGYGHVFITNASWSTARGAANADGNSVGGAYTTSQFSGGNYTNRRGLLPFDSSSIPAGSIINSATLSVKASTLFSSAFLAHVVKTSQASITTIANSDYGTFLFTDGGSVSVAANSTTYQITLNATALSWIIPNGSTKLGLITDLDILNTQPSPGYNDANYDVNTTCTLVVNYTPPGGNFLFNLI